eukprot:14725508-Alexandrium_andersonii.AAC.1
MEASRELTPSARRGESPWCSTQGMARLASRLLSLGLRAAAAASLSGLRGWSACSASRLLWSVASRDLGQVLPAGPAPGALGARAPGGRGA